MIATPTALNLAKEFFATPGVFEQIAPASGVRKTKSSPKEDAKSSEKRKAKSSAKVRKSPSGSGSNLPTIDRLEWNNNSDGGKEAWHVPPGARHRKDKIYLGYVGKRQLAAWGSLDPDARQKVVEGWVATQRERKGIQ